MTYNVALDMTGFCLFLVPQISYFLIFRAQYQAIEDNTYRLQILSTRIALFLPVYAFLIVLSLWGPQAYEFFIIPITLVEGYSFYNFFSLLVSNIGGPSRVVKIMTESTKDYYCCGGCCPSGKVQFYRRTNWAVWHLLITRTVIQCVAAICYYSSTHAGKVLYSLCSIVNAVILFYGIAHLLILYEYVYDFCKNINGVPKLLLLKASVGLIVVQGLIEQFLVMDNASPYEDDSVFDVADKTQRGYCALVLMEFVVLSVISYFAFASKMSAPTVDGSYKETAPVVGGNGVVGVSFGEFFCAILRFGDVFGTLTLNDDTDLSTALNQA